MKSIIQMNVPRCPHCSALLYHETRDEKLFYICANCLTIWQVIGPGQAEIELEVSNTHVEEEKEDASMEEE